MQKKTAFAEGLDKVNEEGEMCLFRYFMYHWMSKFPF